MLCVSKPIEQQRVVGALVCNNKIAKAISNALGHPWMKQKNLPTINFLNKTFIQKHVKQINMLTQNITNWRTCKFTPRQFIQLNQTCDPHRTEKCKERFYRGCQETFISEVYATKIRAVAVTCTDLCNLRFNLSRHKSIHLWGYQVKQNV